MLGASRLTRRDIAKLLGAGASAAAWGGRFGPGVTPVRAQAGSYEGVTIRGLGLAEAAWNAAVEQFASGLAAADPSS